MDLTEFYYTHVVGFYPSDSDSDRNQTAKTFEHLKDAGFADEEIVAVIEKLPAKDAIAPSDLPDELWEGSLIKRDTFYYHRALHIKPKAPTISFSGNVETPKFFLEMKIRFTEEDLLRYFYKKTRFPQDLMDSRRDIAALIYLVNKYDRMDICTGLDFVLFLIDESSKETGVFSNVQQVFDISNVQSEVYEKMTKIAANASFEKANEVRWR